MATIQIHESNGAGQTVTTNISNSNYGNADSANITTTANPIFAGSNSYEKYQRLFVTDFTGISVLNNIRTYRSGNTPVGDDYHVFSCGSSAIAGYTAVTYATPTTAASSVATGSFVDTDPGYATIGLGGALNGSLTATGSGDYVTHQLQVDSATTSGTTMSMVWVYETIA